jgi:hypothetical protein
MRSWGRGKEEEKCAGFPIKRGIKAILNQITFCPGDKVL